MEQGAFLKAARVASGLRQEDVAAKAKINVKTVARAERGDTVSEDTILDICAVLGINSKSVPPPRDGTAPRDAAEPAQAQAAIARIRTRNAALGARLGARLGILGVLAAAFMSVVLGGFGCLMTMILSSRHDEIAEILNAKSVQLSGLTAQAFIERTAAALDAAPPGIAPGVRTVVRNGLPYRVLDAGSDERDWFGRMMEPMWRADDFDVGFSVWPLSLIREQGAKNLKPMFAPITFVAVTPDLILLDVGPVEPAVCAEVVDGMPLSTADRIRFAVRPGHADSSPSPQDYRRPQGAMGSGRGGCAERSVVRVAVARAGAPVERLIATAVAKQGGR